MEHMKSYCGGEGGGEGGFSSCMNFFDSISPCRNWFLLVFFFGEISCTNFLFLSGKVCKANACFFFCATRCTSFGASYSLQ